MKKFVAFLSLLVTLSASAETFTLRFDQVPVTQLLKATYKDLLGMNYGLDAAVISNSRLVSLDVTDLPEQSLIPTVDAVLAQAGVMKNVSPDGVVFFTGPQKVDFGSPLPDSLPSELPPLPAGFASPLPGAAAPGLPAFAGNQIPENFTLYQPKYRPTAILQPIANQFLGVAYQPGDAVFLSGPSESVEKVRYLLEQLDQAPSEIFAKALVIEYSTTETQGNTFEFALEALSGKLKIGLGSLLPVGENFIKFSGTDLTAVLSAVSGDSRFNIVSSPTLRVRDGSTGRVTVGQDVPTLSSTTLDNQGNAQTSVQYRSSGVIFEIKPSILKSRIELELRQEISDFVQTKSSGIDSPTLTKRQISTTVAAQPGELIVLGGLDQNRDDRANRGFSFLPRFARSSSSEKTSTQVLIILQVQRVI